MKEIGQSKRDRIIRAAIHEFSQKGFDRTLLDEIALNAGVAKGTIYLYFKDKEDLFTNTLLFVVDGIVDTIESSIKKYKDPLKKLEMVIREQVRYYMANSEFFGIFQIIIQESFLKTNEKLFELLYQRKNRVIKSIENVIEEAKGKGLIRKDIPTVDIINISDGVVISLLKLVRMKEAGGKYLEKFASVKEVDIEKRIDSAVDMLFNGIRVR